MKIFILLNGYYDFNLNTSYVPFFYDSESIVYVHQNIGKIKKNQKGNVMYVNKYNNVNRGTYHHSTYTVKPGDTLFYIAYISGNSCADLAYNNNVQNVHLLKTGQILKMYSHTRILNFGRFLKIILGSIENSNLMLKKITRLIKGNFLFLQIPKKFFSYVYLTYEKSLYLEISNIVVCNKWHWPTYGKVIDTFSESEGGNKGIDISGKFGQPILAVTNGKVVYARNILQGYGNLIIIKHDNGYLSAYAHNDSILVSEKQKVKTGDKIATMGKSGTNEIKLHFEIKHKGKSVDPLCYLSKNY